MLRRLSANAEAEGLANIGTAVGELSRLDLPWASVDVVVSSYALHHVKNHVKRELAVRARHWVAPGGRFVVADVMFGRGGTREDRALYKAKVRQLLAYGPGGLWRVVKNTVRFGLGVGAERPASPQFWITALRDAGFIQVRYRPIVAEAGLAVGVAPPLCATPSTPPRSSCSTGSVRAES